MKKPKLNLTDVFDESSKWKYGSEPGNMFGTNEDGIRFGVYIDNKYDLSDWFKEHESYETFKENIKCKYTYAGHEFNVVVMLLCLDAGHISDFYKNKK